MFGKTLVSALVALSLVASGGLALAQRNDDRGPENHDRVDERKDVRQDDRRDVRQDDRRDGRQDERREERGAGPQHAFHKGGRLPGEYLKPQYVVSDWRGHHLSAPPRGYQWVQTGGDFVLAAIATGVILNLVLGN